MIAGLPVQSWILIAAAVGLGLIVELAFLRAQLRVRDRQEEPRNAVGTKQP